MHQPSQQTDEQIARQVVEKFKGMPQALLLKHDGAYWTAIIFNTYKHTSTQLAKAITGAARKANAAGIFRLPS